MVALYTWANKVEMRLQRGAVEVTLRAHAISVIFLALLALAFAAWRLPVLPLLHVSEPLRSRLYFERLRTRPIQLGWAV